MQMKSENFSTEEVRRMATSPAGQQLLTLLKNADGTTLQNAAQQAASGNLEDAKKTLAPLLSSPQIQALLRQLGGSGNG